MLSEPEFLELIELARILKSWKFFNSVNSGSEIYTS
jgi:hypothetical protein